MRPRAPFPASRAGPTPVIRSAPSSGRRTRIGPQYDSAKSKAEIRWLKRVVRCSSGAPWLAVAQFETHVSLSSHQPCTEVLSWVLAAVPPAVDTSPPDIKEGYWLSFVPAFEPSTVLRDFPLAIEPTVHRDFHALTFVDLLTKDAGLLVLHAGTQYFKRASNGALSNLIMREWESHWTGEYGWPRYAEYRHALFPHPADFTTLSECGLRLSLPEINSWSVRFNPANCRGGRVLYPWRRTTCRFRPFGRRTGLDSSCGWSR